MSYGISYIFEQSDYRRYAFVIQASTVKSNMIFCTEVTNIVEQRFCHDHSVSMLLSVVQTTQVVFFW